MAHPTIPLESERMTAVVSRARVTALRRPARARVRGARVRRQAVILCLGGAVGLSPATPASVLPIPVLEKDLTFGTDPVQCIRVLDDPSISPLHARIKQIPDGGFVIYDHGSVAGTWVNYEPVTREGRPLAHGDRIHFGQLMYRFDLNQPAAEPEPKIISKKSAL